MRIHQLVGNQKRGRGRVRLILALLCIGFACLNPRPEELPSASLEDGPPSDAARSAPAPASAAGAAEAADNNVPQDAPIEILLVPAPEAPPPSFAPPLDAGITPDAGADAGTD